MLAVLNTGVLIAVCYLYHRDVSEYHRLWAQEMATNITYKEHILRLQRENRDLLQELSKFDRYGAGFYKEVE